MDGLRNPVGDQPAEVYWKRRIILGFSVIAAMLVIWFLIQAGTGGASDADASPGATPNATTSPGVSESPASGEVRACGSTDIEITSAANPAAIPVGEVVSFDVSVKNIGLAPCVLSTSAEGTELLITSGDDRIWSSADCPDQTPLPENEWVLQADASEAFEVSWPGIRSLPECAPEEAKPGEGTYKADLKIQGVASPQSTFNLTP